jgi:hypothetical protein
MAAAALVRQVCLARQVKKSGILVVLALLTALVCSACGGDVTPTASYSAPFKLPFHISIGKQDGRPTLSGNVSWITDLGVISVGLQYTVPPPGPGYILVIVEDRKTALDHDYQVRTNGYRFAAVVNGTTTISVSNNVVTIDVTSGSVRQISFKRVVAPAHAYTSAPGGGWWHTVNSRWDEGWARSWYHPFMLSSWAYDDSTVAKWYGAGFVWFLLRFVLACFLGVIDLIFTVLFYFGQIIVTLFGNSVWPGGLG